MGVLAKCMCAPAWVASRGLGPWAGGLHCAAPCCARGSLRCSGDGLCGITRCARFARSARTDAASQFTKRAARASPSPCAPRQRTGAPQPMAQALDHEVPARHRWSTNSACVRAVPLALGAPVRRRGAQGERPRAKRASLTDSRHLSERSGHRPRSELCRGPLARAPQGSPRAARTDAVALPRPGAPP